MAYFKINNVDYSMYVNSLKITTNTKLFQLNSVPLQQN